MKTTPNPTAEQIIAQAALDADTVLPDALDPEEQAADIGKLAAERLCAAGLLGGDPTEEHLCGDWPAPCNCDDSETHDAAGVAPREPSPVASTPTASDDSGHGGDDNRGGREDGPEDEGRSHQATVAGTPQRPSGCAECHRASGHKMDCSHRLAPSPDREQLIAEAIAGALDSAGIETATGEAWRTDSHEVVTLSAAVSATLRGGEQ